MADGRITIDTGLDTSGFDKDQQKLLSLIQQGARSIERIGGEMQKAFTSTFKPGELISESTFNDNIKAIQARMTKAWSDLDKLSVTSEKGLFNPAQLQNQRIAIERVHEEIRQLVATMGELRTVNIIPASSDALNKQIEEKRQSIKALEDDLKKAQIAQRSFVIGRSKTNQAEKITGLHQSIAAEQKMLDALIEKRDSLTKQRGGQTKEFESLRNTINLAGEAVQALTDDYNRQDSAFARNVQHQIEEAARLAQAKQQEAAAEEAARQRKARMAEKEAMLNQVAQERLAQMAREQEEEAAKEETAAERRAAALQNLKDALIGIGSAIANAAFKGLQVAATQAASAIRSVAQAAIKAPYQMAAAGARALAVAFNGIKTAGSAVLSGLQAIGGALRRAASGFGSLLSKLTLFKRDGSGAGEMATDLVRKLTSLKRMLITRVKRMFISAVFKDMSTALQAIANKSKAFNAAMSGMQNAAKGFTTNLAVTLSNLITVVAPVITQIINWITTLITYLNGFFAMLSGAKSIMTAKKATDAYGKSAGGASKKAQELKKQVMGFDEINNLTEQDESGGGGGGASAPGYEEKLLDDLLPADLQAYFQKLKDAIANEEWEKFGGYIAEAMNSGIEKIDDAILAIHDKLENWAGITARVLNGWVDKFGWEELGEALSHGFNTIIDVENTFLDAFKFTALGAGLGKFVNSMFTSINWRGIGKNFGRKIMAINDTLNGFLKKFKARIAGAKLSVAVKAMFDEIQWTGDGGIADTFSRGINSITDALDAFLKGLEVGGEERRQIFSDALYETVKGIEWGKLIGALGSGFDTIGLWLSTAFVGLTQGISEKAPEITTAINGLIKENSFKEISENVGNGIQNLINGFAKLVDPEEGIKFGELGNSVGEGIATILEKIDFSTLIEAIWNGAGSVARFFSAGFARSTRVLSTKASEIATGINSIVKNNSFDDVIKNVTDGVNNVIDAFDVLINGDGKKKGIDFDGIGEMISNGINSLITDVKFDQAIKTIGTAGVRIFVAFMGMIRRIDFVKIAKKVANGINSIFNDENSDLDWKKIGKIAGEAFRGVIRGITTFLTELDIKDIGKAVGDFLVGMDWPKIAGDMWDAFKTALKTEWNLTDAIINSVLGNEGEWKLGSALQDGVLGPLYTAYMDKVKLYSTSTFFKKKGNDAVRPIFEGLVQATNDGAQYTNENIQQAMLLITEGYSDELFNLDGVLYSKAHDTLINAFNTHNVDQLREVLAGAGLEISSSFAEALGGQGLNDVEAAIKMLCLGIDETTLDNIGLTGLAETIKYYVEECGLSFEDAATALASTVGAAIGDTVNDTVEDELQNGMEQTTNKVTTAASQSMDEGKDSVVESTEAVTSGVVEKWADVPDDVKEDVDLMMQYAQLAIDEGQAGTEEAVQTAADAIVAQFGDILSSNAGTTIGSTFTGGIISGIKSGIIGVYNDMIPVGNAISMGIAKGIRNSQSAVTVAARNAAINAYNAAMRAIDAHSPSKLFANVGKFSMLGWAKGEEDNADAVLGTITDTTSAMEKEAEDTNLNVIDNRMLNGIDLAVDKMEEIASVFSRVADMISGIGELPVPALAEGTVIPYKTKVDMAEVDFSGLEATQPQSMPTPDSFYDVLYRAITDARNDAENDRPIELYLDGTKVMDWIERKGRQNDRARGK